LRYIGGTVESRRATGQSVKLSKQKNILFLPTHALYLTYSILNTEAYSIVLLFENEMKKRHDSQDSCLKE